VLKTVETDGPIYDPEDDNQKVTCQNMVLISEQFPVDADTQSILVNIPGLSNHVTQCLTVTSQTTDIRTQYHSTSVSRTHQALSLKKFNNDILTGST